MITSSNCYFKDSCAKYMRECKKGNENPCGDFCQKIFIINSLYKDALLTEPQQLPIKLNLVKEDEYYYNVLKNIQTNIVDFVQTGQNLYIHSAICGNGKTAWSIKLLQEYLQQTWFKGLRCRALFINVPKFFIELKSSISNQNEYIDHIKQNVLTADLIVWDELGTKTLTDYEHEQLLTIINSRIEAGKSNIYTSNMTPQELNNRLGDRLYSRVVNNSQEIVFNSSDKRFGGIN